MKFEIRIYLMKSNHQKHLKSMKNEIQDGGGRHLEIRKSAVTPEPVDIFS